MKFLSVGQSSQNLELVQEVIFGILLEKTVGRHVKCYVVSYVSFAATMRQQITHIPINTH